MNTSARPAPNVASIHWPKFAGFACGERLICLEGLRQISRSPQAKPANFGQWIEATFGAGLADVFMRPYNLKVWGYPPEAMNAGWVGDRVAVTDLARVLKNLETNTDDISWGPNNTFRFPKNGGTGAVWRA